MTVMSSDFIERALRRTIERTERNCLVYQKGKLFVMRLPKGSEDAKSYKVNGETLKRLDIGIDTDDARLPICIEDTDVAAAGIYLMLRVFAGDGEPH